MTALDANEDKEETAALVLCDDTNTAPLVEELRALRLEWEAMRNDLLWDTGRAVCCTSRAFAVTRNGYMTMVPPGTLAGDDVCLLYGLDTPFIIRSLSMEDGNDNEDWSFVPLFEDGWELVRIVGEAYVHGVMDGEAMHNSAQPEMFNIVYGLREKYKAPKYTSFLIIKSFLSHHNLVDLRAV